MIVDLIPTEDQTQLTEAVDELLRRSLPLERLRNTANIHSQAERAHWQDLAELGLFSLGIPESLGGVGYGLAEQALAARSLGRCAASPSVIATLLATHLSARSGNHELQQKFQEGGMRAAFANPVAPGKIHIIDGADCDWLLLPGGAMRLIQIASVTGRSTVGCLDDSVQLEVAHLDTAQVSGLPGHHTILLLAAYLVGNAQASLAMAVEYAKNRQQFGQPIGAFQAIKHTCADMLTRATAAEAQTFYAAVSEGDSAVEMDSACAFLLASQAAVTNAKANIQIHGAMGFTAECDAHVFLKRAHVIAALGGDSQARRSQILSGSLT